MGDFFRRVWASFSGKGQLREGKCAEPRAETGWLHDVEERDAMLAQHGIDIEKLLGRYGAMKGSKLSRGIMAANAGVWSERHGSLWFGDLLAVQDRPRLQELADKLGCPVHVLEEYDSRFNPPQTVAELREKAAHSFHPSSGKQ